MSDREDFKRRAHAERAAAQAAKDATSFHTHMALAREYDWRAVTEPYPDTDADMDLGARAARRGLDT